MFLKNNKYLLKSHFLRNIILLGLIILISLIIAGYISYDRINKYTISQSRKEISEDLEEYHAMFEEGGLQSIVSDVTEEEEEHSFMNVVENGKIVAENHPSDWNDFDFTSLIIRNDNSDIWIPFHDKQNEYEYITYKLSPTVFIQIGHLINDRNNFIKYIVEIFIYSFLILIGIITIFTIIVADRTITPIRNLTETIEYINNNNEYNKRVELKSNDKMYNTLINNFNYMLARIDELINGMKDSLDNIAHDLKTPLTRFKLSAESSLLDSNSDARSMRESLQTCLEESDRILNIFNSILEISDATYGSINLAKKEIKLRETIESVLNIYEYVLQENKITVSVNIDTNIKLKVDETKMLQAISNIVDNAIKYNKEEHAEIIFNAYTENGVVNLEVKDSGIGIDSSEFDRIFEKLYRIDKNRAKGHGLGLSYANAIIKAHNGRIKVSSKLKVGSTFSVILPV